MGCKNVYAIFPKGVYFHCASNKLNLVVNDLNQVPEVRNKDIINIFRESPLRRAHAPTIPLLCETRWTQNYKSLRMFKENFVTIIKGLQLIAIKGNSISQPVVNSLQAVAIYLVKYSHQIEHIVELVGKHPDKAKETVEAIMNELKAIGIELDVEIRVPQLATKQSFRANPLVSTPEQYFKISILIPYLDSFCNSLKERFSGKQGPAIEL
ncbi:unnamed protein product [Psylliodes chrysocephalus]|uniref:Uncharacterized protein n=1 Tax=Psylliodes chrysocephalus TaxID=3402493 RepID=A0A9P0DBN7_9CUCU|nr:unnamed protein product [Psylliodes chrysocephala]